jgi:hypothetical protein
MARQQEQNYANHVRLIPGYHYVAFGILVLNFLYSIYRLIRYGMLMPGQEGMRCLIAVALLIIFYYARLFVLTVQDRVIRLEMRLRMERLLPAELRTRINEFTVKQLVALRFAGDEELPELAARVLSDRITDGKRIKQMIKNWNPDHLRA